MTFDGTAAVAEHKWRHLASVNNQIRLLATCMATIRGVTQAQCSRTARRTDVPAETGANLSTSIET